MPLKAPFHVSLWTALSWGVAVGAVNVIDRHGMILPTSIPAFARIAGEVAVPAITFTGVWFMSFRPMMTSEEETRNEVSETQKEGRAPHEGETRPLV